MKVLACVMFVCLIAAVYSQAAPQAGRMAAANPMFGGGASSLFALSALGLGQEDISRIFMCRHLNIPMIFCLRGMM